MKAEKYVGMRRAKGPFGGGMRRSLPVNLLFFLLLAEKCFWAQQPALPDAPAPRTSAPKKVAEAPVEAVKSTGDRIKFTSDQLKRFLNQKDAGPLTPPEKARLAARDVLDPFNGATILANAAIAVGSNAYSVYGPGMKGFGENVGVSYAQDISGEFFATFLVPSLTHQDPRYFRRPHAPMPERIRHSLLHVVWAQGDDGQGMPNYGALVGGGASMAISNLYVPGRQTHFSASAQRYGIAIATAPIDNVISEFLPDVAGHIHVQVVVIQRILNRVSQSGTSSVQAVP
jgi:hypothetical protein